MMATMRVATYDSFGPPEVLYVAQRPVPVPAAGEVLVRVHASTVNGGEMAARAGRLTFVTGRRLPRLTGIDLVGEVAQVGAGARGLQVGDRVWGIVDERTLGAAADYVTVSAEHLGPAPVNLSAVEAVSLLAGGMTSVTALRDKARLVPGERLLVRGAAGGVGSLGVQVGKHLGAHVTALAGAGALDFVRRLGADEVRDYRATRPTPDDLGTFDVIFDAAGPDQRAYRRLLAPGGRMVAAAVDMDHPLRGLASIAGSTIFGAGRIRFFRGKPRRADVVELTALAESGALRPVVDTVHPLEEIAAAHRAVEAGGVHGKHVIQVA